MPPAFPMSPMALQHPWRPEDPAFWAGTGQAVARRNLWLSVAALMLATAVWMLWSGVVACLPAAGFHYSPNQLYWLAALPGLCGATLRLFYAFGVPALGGRRFTTLATASLLLPAVGMGVALQDPTTAYEWMVVLALLCGLGGGNFASSMAHIGRCYPGRQQGRALGLNAGLGQLGVVLVPALVPLAIGASLFGAWAGPAQPTPDGPMWLQNAGYVWVPLILAATAAAWWGMDDLADRRAGLAEQAAVFLRGPTWSLCWLYLGSFGSFLGLAASLPLLLHSQFRLGPASPWLWAGPLLCSLLGVLLHPLGGWLADRLGGARVSAGVFLVMSLAAAAALLSLPGHGAGMGLGGPAPQAAARASQAGPFLAAFGVLFGAAGLGSGSVQRMISRHFVHEQLRQAEALPSVQHQALRQGQREAAAALGLASAVGAYGAFAMPKGLGTAMALTGRPDAALLAFIAFYLSCLALAAWACRRRNAHAAF